jgi:putative acetyltransferase
MVPTGLVIRRAEPGDYLAVSRVFSEISVIGGTLQSPYPSAEIWRERLAKVDDSNVLLLGEMEGRVVATAGLHPHPQVRRRHAAHIGLAVAVDYQRRGVGRALLAALVDLADNWFDYRRLELQVFADNTHAIRLYEQFGFVIEGRLREHALRDGAYVDSFTMGRLKAQQA